MNSEALEPELDIIDSEDMEHENVHEGTTVAVAEEGIERKIKAVKNLDSRRKLEDRLEELRLQRETREFDFDF